MRSVALIIVHYRTVADTIECLDSVLRLEVPEGVPRSVVVVDNGSADGSWKELLKWRSKQQALWVREFGRTEQSAETVEASTVRLAETGWEVAMLRAKENNGYAAGANIGLRFAMLDSAVSDFWVLNNDVVLDKASLWHLLKQSEGRPRSIYGSTLLYQDDQSSIQAAGGAVYLPALGRARHVGRRKREEEVVAEKFDYIVGAALFFSREVVEEIGFLPSWFYLYFEETEWAARAMARGIELTWVAESRVIHKEGRSTGAGGGFRHLSDLSFKYVVRNSMLFTELRHPVWIMTVLLFNIFECARHCLYGDFGKPRVLLEALHEYWSYRPHLAREASAVGN